MRGWIVPAKDEGKREPFERSCLSSRAGTTTKEPVIIAEYESIIGKYDGRNCVLRAKSAVLTPGTAVGSRKKVLLCPGGGRITGAQSITTGAGMALYDSVGLLYDSGVLYDAVSSP
jgi:hypothetical protein